MSYCLNPECPNPENLRPVKTCQSCGAPLLLHGRYRILQELGRGGFGATFLAMDESLPGHPNCVIKQLRPAASSPHMMKMARDLFKREAKTLGKIGDHPQVPRLLNYFDDNQDFYLVQEYISGATLQQEVKRSGPFSEAGVKQFLSEILPMIEYIHSQQVIHRDIKPANLIRREQDKKLVLIDFGAVKDKVNPQLAAASEHTALTQYAIGTPGYAPPEQMAMRPVFASDIYALGITCLFLLTGRSPKDMRYDPTTGELMWQEHVHISAHFTKVVQRMLEVSVRQRYQSAEDVLKALDLVPYMDSLADSMMSPRSNRGNQLGEPLTSGPHTGGNPSSPSSRLAAQIRARKNRKSSDTRGGGPRSGHLARERSGPLTRGLSSRESNSRGPNSRGPNSRGPNSRNPNSRGPSSRGPNSRGLNSLGTHGRSASSSLGSGGRGINSRGRAKSDLSATHSAATHTSDSVLASYARGRRNFAACDLSMLNLERADLTGANFHEANFRQARLSHVNLQQTDLGGANFGQANLNNASLRNANLVGAFLTNADLANADLRGANLSYAHLSNANLRGANLCGADLSGAKVSETQLAMARTNWKTIHPNKRRALW